MFHASLNQPQRHCGLKFFPALAVILFLAFAQGALGQVFDSGSTGADGALLLDTPGTVLFDPTNFDPPLDADGDGVYHFTTITIAADVVVRLGADLLGHRPIVWLATGDVVIEGTVDLNGEHGHDWDGVRRPAIPGAGGFEGGRGGVATLDATAGSGPGGGGVAPPNGLSARLGGGAGHVTAGASFGVSHGSGGPAYGNSFLVPLVGGSGGGGANHFRFGDGGGGGAGGGAILIASSTRIVVNGALGARGGDGGVGISNNHGGGGSGGAIRLMAPLLEGTGSIDAGNGHGGFSLENQGSPGRVSLETPQYNFSGTSDGVPRITQYLGPVFPTFENAPAVRLVRIAGVAVPANSKGRFNPADLTLESTGEATVEIEANNIPLGTVVNLSLVAEGGEVIAFDSTPLAGLPELSTATATVTIPPGFSLFTVLASYTP